MCLGRHRHRHERESSSEEVQLLHRCVLLLAAAAPAAKCRHVLSVLRHLLVPKPRLQPDGQKHQRADRRESFLALLGREVVLLLPGQLQQPVEHRR